MQQALYNNSNGSTIVKTTRPANAAARATDGTGLLRWIGRKWDLVGVVTLMGSSAVYGVFALLHLA